MTNILPGLHEPTGPGARPRPATRGRAGESRRTAVGVAIAGALCLACGLSGRAIADEAPTAPELGGEVTIYGWLPGVDGAFSTDGRSRETSINSASVLEALQFAAMGNAAVHYGRFGTALDVVYANFSTDGTLSGPLASSVGVGLDLTLVTGVLTYELLDHRRGRLAAMAGARVVSIDTDVSIRGGGPLGLQGRDSFGKTFVDPIIGFNGAYNLTDYLSFDTFADVGGFGVGSQLSWEAYGGLGLAFTDRISGKIGYRYLSIDYSSDGRTFDVDFDGPVVGVTVRF